MQTVTVERLSDASASKIWDALDDFQGIHKFNPFVRSVDLMSENPTGLGAKRLCHFYDGNSLAEVITDYRPGQSYRIQMSEFHMPLKRGFAGFDLYPTTDGKTRIRFQMAFEPKFGPLGWLMAVLMMKPMLRKMMTKVLKGLDDHVRSGKTVGKDGTLLETPDAA